jgi:HlyD family secretion protein
MSQKSIFPTESIEFSTEYHLSKNTVKSQIIYSAIVISIIAVIFLLPYIYVDVTVQADGFIRPESEKTEIKPNTSGIVTKIFIKESQNIEKGDTLLTLRNDQGKSQIEFAEYQINQTKDFIHDLKQLTESESENSPKLNSSYYQQNYIENLQKKTEIENRLQKAQKELDRNKPLFEKGFLPAKDYDDLKYNVQLVENELKTFKESTRNSRQNELVQKQNELKQLLSQMVQYRQEETDFIIKSPVSGTVEQFSGIYIGSNLQAGQTVVIISPQSAVIAEVYAAPKDIGYLSVGNKANIQVDAFNYNDWGMLHGEITEISNDYILSGDKPFFRVRCTLDKTYLQLKNGFRGDLKKGMTVRCHFLITKRSLWQLLFDNVNDWMNPALNKM